MADMSQVTDKVSQISDKYTKAYDKGTGQITLYENRKDYLGNSIGLKVYASPNASFTDILTAGSLSGAIDAVQTGDWKGFGSSVGSSVATSAITAGLSLVPGGPLIAPLVGPLVGSLFGGKKGVDPVQASIQQGFNVVSGKLDYLQEGMQQGFNAVNGKLDYLQASLTDMHSDMLNAFNQQTATLTAEIDSARNILLGSMEEMKGELDSIQSNLSGLDLSLTVAREQLEGSLTAGFDSLSARMAQEKSELQAMTSIAGNKIIELREQSQQRITQLWETVYTESSDMLLAAKQQALVDTLRFIDNVRNSALQAFDARVEAEIQKNLSLTGTTLPSGGTPETGTNTNAGTVQNAEEPGKAQEPQAPTPAAPSGFPWWLVLGGVAVGGAIAYKRRIK